MTKSKETLVLLVVQMASFIAPVGIPCLLISMAKERASTGTAEVTFWLPANSLVTTDLEEFRKKEDFDPSSRTHLTFSAYQESTIGDGPHNVVLTDRFIKYQCRHGDKLFTTATSLPGPWFVEVKEVKNLGNGRLRLAISPPELWGCSKAILLGFPIGAVISALIGETVILCYKKFGLSQNELMGAVAV